MSEQFRILKQTVEREERAERLFELEGLPPLVEYKRHRYRAEAVDVLLTVDSVRLVWVNGEFRVARVDGRRLKMDGPPGALTGARLYGRRWFELEDVTDENRPPDWLADLVRLSPEPSMLEYQTQQDQEKRKRAGT